MSNPLRSVAGYAACAIRNPLVSFPSMTEHIFSRFRLSLTIDFQGIQGDMVTQTLIDKMQSLDRLYYLAAYMGRQDVLAQLNDYYRTLGIYENELIHPDLSTPSDSVQIPE